MFYKFAVVFQGNARCDDLAPRRRKSLHEGISLALGFISVQFLAPGVRAGHCQLFINMPNEQVLYNLMESKHLTCTPKVMRYAHIFKWSTRGISPPHSHTIVDAKLIILQTQIIQSNQLAVAILVLSVPSSCCTLLCSCAIYRAYFRN